MMAQHAKQPSEALMQCLQFYFNDFAQFIKEKQNAVITKKDILPLSVKILLRTPKKELDDKYYNENYRSLCNSICKISKSSPILKPFLFRMVTQRIKEYKEKNGNYMPYLSNFVKLIETFYEETKQESKNTPEILRSLMIAYKKPSDFYDLLTVINTLESNEKYKLLEIIAKLANNTLVSDSLPRIEEIKEVCNKITKDRD